MKKLTNKHIVPYLDHGLQFAFLDDIDGDKGTLTGLLMFGDTPNVQLKFRGSTGLFDYEDVKPILRPLSDLTKGELKKLRFKSNDVILSGGDIWADSIWALRGMIESVDYLYRHHFDVSGLIEKGLAIDINTLNK